MTPTLVLGIGGAAGRVLSHFRRMLHDRLRAARDLPAVQLLLLDTDPRALADSARRDESGLSPDETLNLPLRRPQHYRDHSQKLLNWLSRRWLYNIPRSLRTEGLRPLGRLGTHRSCPTDRPAHSPRRQPGARSRRDFGNCPRNAAATSQRCGPCVCRRFNFRRHGQRDVDRCRLHGPSGSGKTQPRPVAHHGNHDALDRRRSTAHRAGTRQRLCLAIGIPAFFAATEPVSRATRVAACRHTRPEYRPSITRIWFTSERTSMAWSSTQAAQSVAEYLQLNTLTPASAFFDGCREARDQSATGDTPQACRAVCVRSESTGTPPHRAICAINLRRW